MAFTIAHHRSRLFDFLRIPSIVLYPTHQIDGLSASQQRIVKEFEETYHLIYQQFSPFKEDLVRCYLLDNHSIGFGVILYYYLLSKGEDPKDIDELLTLIKQLKHHEIVKCLAIKLSGKDSQNNDLEELMLILENSDKESRQKWDWYQALKYPERLINDLCQLIKITSNLYEPFYQTIEEEVRLFEKNFQLEHWLEGDEVVEEKLRESGSQLFALAPWAVEYFIEKHDFFSPLSYSLVIGTRVGDMLYDKSQLDDERLVLLLRMLADETRYKVLLELAKSGSKNKEIAQKLNLNKASISFHTKKLLNSGLLDMILDDGKVNYRLNEELVRLLLNKLDSDFGINQNLVDKH